MSTARYTQLLWSKSRAPFPQWRQSASSVPSLDHCLLQRLHTGPVIKEDRVMPQGRGKGGGEGRGGEGGEEGRGEGERMTERGKGREGEGGGKKEVGGRKKREGHPNIILYCAQS